jgi:hypothetical protein
MPCAQNTSVEPHFGQNLSLNLAFRFLAEPFLALAFIDGYLFFLFNVFFKNLFLGSLGFLTRCTSVAKTHPPILLLSSALKNFDLRPKTLVQGLALSLRLNFTTHNGQLTNASGRGP